jgi:hypothetical protein
LCATHRSIRLVYDTSMPHTCTMLMVRRRRQVYLERTLQETARGKLSGEETRQRMKAAIEFGFKVHQFVGGFSPKCNALLTRVEAVLAALKD